MSNVDIKCLLSCTIQMPDFLTFLFFRTHIEIKSSIISKYQQVPQQSMISRLKIIYTFTIKGNVIIIDTILPCHLQQL